MLGLLDDLVEVTVESFRDFLVLTLVVVLGTEFEASLSSQVVEVQHLRVLPESVQDNLAHFNEEGDVWHQSILLLNFTVLAVGHQDKIIRIDVSIPTEECQILSTIFTKHLSEFVLSFYFFHLLNDVLSLGFQGLEDIPDKFKSINSRLDEIFTFYNKYS